LKTNYKPINVSKKTLFFFTLFFIGLMSASVTHAETYTYVAKWGSPGSDDGQFKTPIGIDVDSSDNVYVADFGNHRIQKFDGNGNLITKWGSFGTGNGQFNYPRDVAVDSSDNVYVAEERNNRIQKFDSNGNFIFQWGSSGTGDGQLNIPLCIAVDSSNNVYITDLAANSGWAYPRIQKFSSDGTFISKLGSSGTGDGQLNSPNDIAVDSLDNVYVADTNNNRIQKFDSNGNFITKWGSSGTGDEQFLNAYGIAVDSSDNVYVADTGNHRIQKFDSNGNFITKWGSEGIDYGQFKYPWDVAIDSLGNAYVTDTENQRIQKFSIEKFTPTMTWSTPADIIYGTALGSTQLSASASVLGTFTYTSPAGTLLGTGTQKLHVDFTPTDSANYNTASKDITINVLKATPAITWNNPADIIAGKELSNIQLSASVSVPGTFVYNKQLGAILDIGIHTLHVDFTPTDVVNYTTASKDVTINVLEKPAIPSANFWATPITGKVPLEVQFTDKSAGVPTSWLWDFGDKSISTEKNPVYTYNKAGKYTVSLTVKNELGSNTRKISKYIIVEK